MISIGVRGVGGGTESGGSILQRCNAALAAVHPGSCEGPHVVATLQLLDSQLAKRLGVSTCYSFLCARTSLPCKVCQLRMSHLKGSVQLGDVHAFQTNRPAPLKPHRERSNKDNTISESDTIAGYSHRWLPGSHHFRSRACSSDHW